MNGCSKLSPFSGRAVVVHAFEMTYLHTQRVVSQLLLMCVSCTAQILMPGQQKDTNGHNGANNQNLSDYVMITVKKTGKH